MLFVVFIVKTFCKTFDAKLAEVETAPEDTFLRHEANVYKGMFHLKYTHKYILNVPTINITVDISNIIGTYSVSNFTSITNKK